MTLRKQRLNYSFKLVRIKGLPPVMPFENRIFFRTLMQYAYIYSQDKNIIIKLMFSSMLYAILDILHIF